MTIKLSAMDNGNNHEPNFSLTEILEELQISIKFFDNSKDLPNLLREADFHAVDSSSKIEVFTYKNLLKDILKKVNNKYTYVEMDSNLFAQVFSYLLFREDTADFQLNRGCALNERCYYIALFSDNGDDQGVWLIRDKRQLVGLTKKGLMGTTFREYYSIR
jgi:hypothetical protein